MFQPGDILQWIGAALDVMGAYFVASRHTRIRARICQGSVIPRNSNLSEIDQSWTFKMPGNIWAAFK